MRTDVRRLLEVGTLLVASLILVYVVDVDKLVSTVRTTDPFVYGAAVTVYVGTYLPLGVRWQRIQRSVGYHRPVLECIEVVSISYSFNRLLPANMGDVGRSRVANRYFDINSHTELLGLVGVERSLDLVSIAVLLVGSSLLVGLETGSQIVRVGAGVLLVVVGLVVSLRYTALDRVTAVCPPLLRTVVEDLLSGFRRLSGVDIGVVLSLSFVRWIGNVVVLVLVADAISTELSIPFATFVLAAMSLTATLPLTPGGVGPVDAVGTGLLVVVGLGASKALAVVLLQRGIGLGLTAVLGLVVYGYRLIVDWG